MGVPVRLKYNDVNDGMTTFGTMLTGGNDNITTATLKNSADEYTKLVIEGNESLQDLMPVSETSFGLAKNGESEPEILVEVYQNGSWTVRDRVYATKGGKTKDNGFYKNDNLYGFEKYHGEQRVEISTPVTTNSADAMSQGLPPGYTLVVPGDVTPPEVNDFTFKGRFENLVTDLTKKHDWVLIYTSDLDANNDYKVRFEPRGYGGQEGTIVRGEDPIVYDYWEKKDTKTVVSEVTVKGTNSNNESVEVTRTSSDLGETPDLQRSIEVSVGYRLGTSTDGSGLNEEAKSIADSLIQSSFVEHGALEGPMYVDNTVNFSVGISDSEKGIDDLFTVAMQKDYFHQGETYFSFEFEKEANIQQSLLEKGVREERNSLFSGSLKDVGNQNVNANTETVNDSYDSHSSSKHPHHVGGKTSTSEGGSSIIEEGFFSSSYSNGISNSFVNVGTQTPSNHGAGCLVYITFNKTGSITGRNYYTMDISVGHDWDNDGTVEEITSAGNAYPEPTLLDDTDNGMIFNGFVYCPYPIVSGNDIDVYVRTASGTTGPCEVETRVKVLGLHTHDIEYETDRALEESDGSTNAINSSDSSAGDTSSLSASGSTDAKNVNVETEDKTDR